MTVQRSVKYFFAPNSSDIPEKWCRKKEEKRHLRSTKLFAFQENAKEIFCLSAEN